MLLFPELSVNSNRKPVTKQTGTAFVIKSSRVIGEKHFQTAFQCFVCVCVCVRDFSTHIIMSKLKNVSKICFLLLGALLVHLCCWSQPALAGGKKGDTIVLGGGKGGGGHGGGYGHGGGGGGCGPIILKTGKYLFYFNFF